MQTNPIDTYFQEADELLADIEATALSMTADPAGGEAVNQIFRAFHTIKGSGAMFGCDDVANFTHHVETLLDQVREGVVPVSDELSNVILAAADQIKLLLQVAQGGRPVDGDGAAALLDRVHCLSAAAEMSAPVAVETQAATQLPAHQALPQVWNISFRPNPTFLCRGGNPALLFRDLRKLGESVIEGHSEELPALAELQTDVCYLWWKIQLTTAVDSACIRDVFLFVEDGSQLTIEQAVEQPGAPASPQPVPSASRPRGMRRSVPPARKLCPGKPPSGCRHRDSTAW
jgi:two-component system chemotaxis sensor kinase CheA